MKHAAVLASLLFVLPPALAQMGPGGTVALVVPAAPGGPSDVLARVLSEKLKTSLGQNVVVENRGGANGTIGVAAVARSTPDGRSVLLAVDGPVTTIPALMSNVSYDAARDLTPVAVVGDGGDVMLAVQTESPARDAQQLVQQMRADPAKANYVSSGAGFTSHIVAELFKKEAQFDAQHVAVRGSGAAMAELLSGRYSFAFVPASLAAVQSKAGKIRVLASASERRNNLLPDVPTLAEAGFKGVAAPSYWIGLYVPSATPTAVVTRLAGDANAIVKGKEFGELLRAQGMVATSASPAEIQARVARESAFWARTVKQLDIRME